MKMIQSKSPKKRKAPAEDPADVSDSDSSSEIDEMTAQLAAGLNPEDDKVDSPQDQFESFDSRDQVPTLGIAQTTQIEKLGKSKTKEGPGVVFIGRIPHGFYEKEMRAYFTQFGDITRLRLARNKKSAASKHYAFVEFASAEVATIVAKTMNNYLLFNHILKVAVIPPENIHPELFKGANQRFRKIPRNKLQGRRLAEGKDAATWNFRIEREMQRRQDKARKMQEMDYEFYSPDLASAPLAVVGTDNTDTKPAKMVTDESAKTGKHVRET
ncbi:MAG: MKI67 FHA domain-interacting nucleolar phosphoprotein [Vezdaea aestivalis]|nr:MAG: MKI67 FHA domain-interacting nucleolar phosphoprotein [Vezdaea aestivalis]